MVVAVYGIKGTLPAEKARECYGRGGRLNWRRTVVNLRAQAQQARSERAEIPLFEGKVEVRPGLPGPGPVETIQPTLNAARVQMAQNVENSH